MFLTEIITLKNQKNVYIVENEGFLCTAKRMHVNIQFQLNVEEETAETPNDEPNTQY